MYVKSTVQFMSANRIYEILAEVPGVISICGEEVIQTPQPSRSSLRSQESLWQQCLQQVVITIQKVLLHGVLCDAHGRKMSKSLGNVISPENVITGISLEELQHQSHMSVEAGLLSQEECDKAVSGQAKLFPKGIPECGTDALRFTLASHNIKRTSITL
uniref:valine--tRNA ligase n=1 Tax=Timema bartmani TaxID=61472 RepID=A0A7R9I313_9NEOP|nr:unnamed protein product [Timema bartmani]